MTDLFWDNVSSFTQSGSQEIELIYTSRQKLKKLGGFEKSRHFLPKYYSKALEDFVADIAFEDIRRYCVEIIDPLRDYLELGIEDYVFEVDGTNGAWFKSKELTFQLNCRPDPDKLDEAIFTHTLKLEEPALKAGPEMEDRIDHLEKIMSAFPYSFNKAVLFLSAGLNLEDFIAALERHFGVHSKKAETAGDPLNGHQKKKFYYYDPEANFLEMEFSEPPVKVKLWPDKMEVYFSASFGVLDFYRKLEGGI